MRLGWANDNALPIDVTGPIPGAVNEIGTGLLRYDGTPLFVGGNQNTAIYTPGARVKWTNGLAILSPDGQTQLGVIDGPGAIPPNGNILVGAGYRFGSDVEWPTSSRRRRLRVNSESALKGRRFSRP